MEPVQLILRFKTEPRQFMDIYMGASTSWMAPTQAHILH